MVSLKALRDISRIQHGILGVIAGLTGAFIAAALDEEYIVYGTDMLYGIWIPILLICGTMALNDFYDREVDIANNRMDRPLARGELDPKWVLICSLIALIIGSLMTLYFSVLLFIGTIFFTGIATAYNLRLKHYKMVGNVLVPLCIASIYILGALVVEPTDTDVHITILSITLLSFFLTVGREIIKDIHDVEGDTAITLARKMGTEFAARVASILLVLVIILCPLPALVGFEDEGWRLYTVLMGICVLIIIYVIYSILKDPTPTTAAKCRKLTFYVLLVGSLAMLVGALGTNVPEFEMTR